MTGKARKVVVVGDGMVGKTALLSAFMNEQIEHNYVPTIFETDAKDVHLPDGRQITLGLWDTGGQEEFGQIRQLAYPNASLILLCYSVDCLTSLENITETWIPEVKRYCPNVPIMLTGCKSDYRNSSIKDGISDGSRLINPVDAQRVGDAIGAQVVIECSALLNSNVYTVFQLAARFILDSEKRSYKNTNLLHRFSHQFAAAATATTMAHFAQNEKELTNSNLNNINSKLLNRKHSLKRHSSDLKKRINSPNYICFIKRRTT